MMPKSEEIAPYEGIPGFTTLEATSRLAVETAHRTIAQLAALPVLNSAGARQLKILHELIESEQRLEVYRYLAMKKVSQPDLDKADRIARGEEK